MSDSEEAEDLEVLYCWMDEARVCGAGCVAYSHDKQQTPTHCLLLITPARTNIHLTRINESLKTRL